MRNLAILLSVSIAAQPLLQAQCSYSTVAGYAQTFRGEGVPVAQSRLNAPEAIAVASDGSIFVADTQNNRVRRITPDGIIRTFAGTGEPAFSGDGGQAGKAALNQPRGLAFGPDGILYIADTLNNRVRVVTANGIIRTAAGEGHARFGGDGGPAAAASLNLPTSVTVDKSGNLFVVDSVNFRIRKVTPAGVITTVAGSQGSDDYNFRAVVRLPLQLQGQPFRFTARHGRAPERMVKSTFPMQLRSGVLTVMGT